MELAFGRACAGRRRRLHPLDRDPRRIAPLLAVLVVAACASGPSAGAASRPASTGTASAGPTAGSASPPASSSTTAGSEPPGSCADVLGTGDGRIVFTIWGTAPDALAIVKADGSGFRRILEPSPGQEQHDTGNHGPRWAPADEVLFSRAVEPDGWHLSSVALTAGKPRDVTGGPDGIEDSGAISRDGSLLAYHKVAATSDASEPLREAGIFVSEADGTGEHQLTSVSGEQVDTTPDFSTDGRKLAFTRELGGAPGAHRGSIWVVNADGTGLREITDPKLDAIRPRWSPDGQWIAFSSNADNFLSESANVWLVRPDGTEAHRLTRASAGGQAFFPDWSPDGAHIAFLQVSAGADSQDLAVIDADGNPTCTLWAGPPGQLPGDPDWGPA